MMPFLPQSQQPQPPRVAQWLVDLFTPSETAESLTGDLCEEFAGLVTELGVVGARRWYWRQCLRTARDAGANAFRSAPLLMLVSVFGGFWLIGFATRQSTYAMQGFLDANRVYDLHPNAYMFWSRFPLEFGRVILCGLVGGLVALAARRNEMIAVMTLSVVEIGLFLAGTVALIVHGREWSEWFIFMLRWNVLCSLAITAGGMIVRKSRHSAAIS